LFDVYYVLEPRHSVTYRYTPVVTALTHLITVKRKDVTSRAAVLMGFAGIVTQYVNPHVISLYEETHGAQFST
jgi:hypothetical protein